MTRAQIIMCLLTGLLVWVSMTPVEARRDELSTQREATREDGLSLDEAVARVRRDTGGRVLSAETRDDHGRPSYRIKVLLPNGSVRVVNVDAQSGEMR